MDVLANAALVHESWKERFLELVRSERLIGSAGGSRPGGVQTLAEWLEGEGRFRWGSSPEYRVLRHAHSRFYQLAGAVVRLATRDAFAAEWALNGADFARASDQLAAALNSMRLAIAAKQRTARAPLPRVA